MELPNRAALETGLARKLARLSQDQYRRLLATLGDPPKMENLPGDYFNGMAAELQGVLQPALEDAYTLQAAALMGLKTNKALAVDWTVINQRAALWAKQYAGLLCKQMSDRTREAIRAQVADFFRDQRSMDDLTASLARLFGPIRAELIAVTEVTRAASMGEQGFAEELRGMGLRTTFIWQTANDDTVCPICGPLHGSKQGDGWHDPPPAHPRCRCWINTVVERG
jgi:hypothetical protein